MIVVKPSTVHGKDGSVGSYDRTAAGTSVDDHGCTEAWAGQEYFVTSVWIMLKEQAIEETVFEAYDLRLARLYVRLWVRIRAYRTSNRWWNCSKRENLIWHWRSSGAVVHWRSYSDRDISNEMPSGSMDWSYNVMVVGQELKNAEGASNITLFIKDSFYYMRSSDEDTVLSNEEAGPDRNKDTILSLRDNGKDSLAEVRLRSVA